MGCGLVTCPPNIRFAGYFPLAFPSRMSYKIPASEFYSEHVCCLIGMFPSEVVNSSDQMVLLLVSTLSYNVEPWNKGSDA